MSNPKSQHQLALVRSKILAGEIPTDEEMADLMRQIVRKWPFEVDAMALFEGKGVVPDVKWDS